MNPLLCLVKASSHILNITIITDSRSAHAVFLVNHPPGADSGHRRQNAHECWLFIFAYVFICLSL